MANLQAKFVVCMCMYVCTYVCVCMYVCMYVRVCMYVCMMYVATSRMYVRKFNWLEPAQMCFVSQSMIKEFDGKYINKGIHTYPHPHPYIHYTLHTHTNILTKFHICAHRTYTLGLDSVHDFKWNSSDIIHLRNIKILIASDVIFDDLYTVCMHVCLCMYVCYVCIYVCMHRMDWYPS